MSRTVADTGTHPNRRPLTLDEAQRGVLPEPFTKDEWRIMARASRGGRVSDLYSGLFGELLRDTNEAAFAMANGTSEERIGGLESTYLAAGERLAACAYERIDLHGRVVDLENKVRQLLPDLT